MGISEASFGRSSSGVEALEWTVTNDSGASVKVINYGASITSLRIPAKDGKIVDVVLGYDDLRSYEEAPFYLGATVGRCANRIGGARFRLENREFSLKANNGPNHLHGGVKGFDKWMWKRIREEDPDKLSLRLTSPDGDEGYPGQLTVDVSFSLASSSPDLHELSIAYEATTTATTVVNLTNHSYFNLSGHDCGSVYDQNLQMFADRYLATDSDGLSVGPLQSVEGGVFDFRQPVMLGYRLDHMVSSDNPYGGYDNSFADFTNCDSYVPVNGYPSLKKVAELVSNLTKIRMSVWTTKPALHLYTGNFLSSDGPRGKDGADYPRHSGVCFETQFHPNAVNRAEFPSPVLTPRDSYRHRTVFCFSRAPPSYGV